MRDIKQCLIDLLRSGGISVGDSHNSPTTPTSKISHKPKKLHEYTAADCNAAFLRKYYEVGNGGFNANNNGIIYFNENLTMTSKYDMRQFPMNRYSSCPLSTFSNSDDSVSPPPSSKSENHPTTEDTESFQYDYSSEDDRDTLIDCCSHTNNPVNADLPARNCCDNDEALLDSFCTLCTSSFSYNKCCRYCDNSQCGSKCNSERGSHTSRKSQHHVPTIQRNNLNLR